MQIFKDEDLIGKRFGRLVVLNVFRKKGKRGKAIRFCHCKCDCGKEKDIVAYSIIKELTGSCGCKGRENRVKANTTHNFSKHTICRTLYIMKQRCYNKNNPKYKIYGERGVTICDEWLKDPSKFIEWSLNNGWKKGLTIDRINVNGNYEPNNCRWTNNHVQTANRRKQEDSQTKYIGIRQDKRYENSWVARININNKRLHIGTYRSQKDALEARNNYIIENKLFEYPIQEWKGE